jgi:uncharacterized membrane protein
VIDGIAVHKDKDGEVKVIERSDLTDEENAEFGAYVGALIGLGAGGLEGAELGAVAGASVASERHESGGDEVWDVLDEIPADTAAAVILLEHRWAIPLRDAVRGAGGYPVSDGWIHPEDLVAIGMIAAEEAAAAQSR